jgi:hypothetical protein
MRRLALLLVTTGLFLPAGDHLPARVTVGITPMGAGLSTVAGLLAGWLPVGQAANLPVLDTLRAE